MVTTHCHHFTPSATTLPTTTIHTGSYHGNHLPPSWWTTPLLSLYTICHYRYHSAAIMTHHLPLHCLLLPYLLAAIMVAIYCHNGGPPTVITVHHPPLSVSQCRYHDTPSATTLPTATILAGSCHGNNLLPSWWNTHCHHCTTSATIGITVQLSWTPSATALPAIIILASSYRGNHPPPSINAFFKYIYLTLVKKIFTRKYKATENYKRLEKI